VFGKPSRAVAFKLGHQLAGTQTQVKGNFASHSSCGYSAAMFASL
jgi:hypothetical protein